jgi:GT2 family glycosyltransferase
VKNSVNVGFSRGFNAGIRAASGDYIVILNNDIRLDRDAFRNLISVLNSNESIGMAYSKTLSMADPRIIQRFGSYFTRTGFLFHEGLDSVDRGEEQIRFFFNPVAASLMIRSEALRKTGLFDDDFFAYFEESDLAWRFWMAGYKVAYVPSSIVYHWEGGALSKCSYAFRQYNSFRNRLCSLIKNLGTKNLFTVVPVHLLFCGLAMCAHLVKGDARTLVSLLRAMVWNLLNLKKTFRKRAFIQKFVRTIPDEKFLTGLTRPINIGYLLNVFKGVYHPSTEESTPKRNDT